MKKTVIIITAILVTLAVTGFIVFRFVSALGKSAETDPKVDTPVAVMTVSHEDIASVVNLGGKVQAKTEAAIVPKTPGKVTKVNVKISDFVYAGQVLFSMDKKDLQPSYQQAQAALDLAQYSYDSAKEKISQAKEELEKARDLLEAGLIQEDDFKQLEAAASDEPLIPLEAQLEQAKASLQAVNNSMSDMDIRAPISGVVTSLSIFPGGFALSATASMTIVDMGSVYVSVGVSEKIINYVRAGQEVHVSIAAAGVENLWGTVSEVSQAADQRTGLFMMRVLLDNAAQLFKPGMFANVAITTESKRDVIVVPQSAVLLHDGADVVYVVADGKAERREVGLGLEGEGQVEVLSGLMPGDILIVSGQEYAKDGLPVRVVEKDGEPQT